MEIIGPEGRFSLAMKYQALLGAGASPKKLEVEQLPDGKIRIGDKILSVHVEVLDPGIYSLIIDGASYEVSVRDEKKGFMVEVGPHLIPVRLEDPFKSQSAQGKDTIEGEVVIGSPMPGRVVGLQVTVGQEVQEGEGVVLVEAMKMENELHTPKTGKVTKILVKIGDTVEAGQDLVVIE